MAKMASGLIIALLLVASTAPALIAKPGTSIDNALAYPTYHSSPSNGTNAIINGNFETDDFTGWITVNHPVIDYNTSEIYNGSYSAMNNHYYDYFYQPLNFTISDRSVFSSAVFATVMVSDSDWHEIKLTITKPGLTTINLHYRVQSTQPSDNATDKYFLIGKDARQWFAVNRPVKNDLVYKGVAQYLGGTVTNITCQQGGVCCTVYDSLRLMDYYPSDTAGNAIFNGDFEMENFTGWTTGYHPIIDYNIGEVYHGLYSAQNNHYYDYFYQPLTFNLSYNSTFSGAMYAIVAISDLDWHETRLTITMPGLPALYLHYRLQSNQPVDTSTNKYFLIGTQLNSWYSWDHNLYSDLSEKGVTQYLNGTVTEIMCQQGGATSGQECCTAYDAFELSPSSGSGTKIDSPVYSFVILGVAGLFTLVAIAAAVSLRSRGSREYGNAPTEPEVIGDGFDEEASSGERSALIPSTEKCARCGASVASHDASYCTNCGARLGALSQSNAASPMRGKPVAIGTCMVCGLKLGDRDVVAKCPNCGSIGHRVHVLEWLHVKGYCPVCRRHLDERDLKN